jgi:hypothetical protein
MAAAVIAEQDVFAPCEFRRGCLCPRRGKRGRHHHGTAHETGLGSNQCAPSGRILMRSLDGGSAAVRVWSPAYDLLGAVAVQIANEFLDAPTCLSFDSVR